MGLFWAQEPLKGSPFIIWRMFIIKKMTMSAAKAAPNEVNI
jgi:hypothetical protein